MDLSFAEFVGGVVAAVVIGIAKGGFGGVGTVIAVPIMSLSTPPAITLGVMLPILMLADLISVGSHWRDFDRGAVTVALPGAAVGVAVGAALLAVVDGAVITLAIGIISIAFALQALWRSHRASFGARPGLLGATRLASLFGLAAGITSTLAHAGGPPIHMHYLARGYSPVVFVATASVFMASLNLMKVLPYLLVGAVDRATLAFSAKLVPIVVVAAFAGVWLARRIDRRRFALAVNLLMLVVGLKLLIDGLAAVAGR